MLDNLFWVSSMEKREVGTDLWTWEKGEGKMYGESDMENLYSYVNRQPIGDLLCLRNSNRAPVSFSESRRWRRVQEESLCICL